MHLKTLPYLWVILQDCHETLRFVACIRRRLPSRARLQGFPRGGPMKRRLAAEAAAKRRRVAAAPGALASAASGAPASGTAASPAVGAAASSAQSAPGPDPLYHGTEHRAWLLERYALGKLSARSGPIPARRPDVVTEWRCGTLSPHLWSLRRGLRGGVGAGGRRGGDGGESG